MQNMFITTSSHFFRRIKVFKLFSQLALINLSMSTTTLPGFTSQTTMKAAQIIDYGPIEKMVSVEDNVPIPRLSSIPEKKRHNYLILKTLAVSLAPGDVRTLSGKTKELQGPPSFPYIPGGDCSGIVVEVSNDTKKGKKDDFDVKVGDFVAARFYDFPRNCLGEYAIVHKGTCEKVPVKSDKNEKEEKDITPEAAAALAGASPAICLADRVKKNERVLIFGAGGGVGSHLCQLLRERGVSFIAGVSKNPDRLLEKPLLCDVAIDYTKENIWTKKEFLNEPFDVIFDLASGQWPEIIKHSEQKRSIIKSAKNGGRFLTPTADEAWFEVHSVWAAIKLFVFSPLGRAIKSRTFSRSSLPKFTYAMSLPSKRNVVTRILNHAKSGSVEASIHGPFEFTTKGVQEALLVQESHHPQGKVVVKIADV